VERERLVALGAFGPLGIISEFSCILARFRVINSSNCLAESRWNPFERENARMPRKNANRQPGNSRSFAALRMTALPVPPFHGSTVQSSTPLNALAISSGVNGFRKKLSPSSSTPCSSIRSSV
jgi:hypothetical protein